MFWRKRGQEKQKKFEATEMVEIIDKEVKSLELKEGEEVLGALPIYIGVRDDFDPTHSWSCASARSELTQFRLGVFINTTMRLIFKQSEEDGSLSTILNVPLEKIYEVEVSGVKEKRLEILTSSGSFEFKGFDNDKGIYRIAEGLRDLSDIAREREFPTISMITCSYCGVRNKSDASFCVNCGAPLK
jgi:hypothetical protein